MIFNSVKGERPEEPLYKFGALKSFFLTRKLKVIFNFKDIKSIHSRKYNLIECALEIFTNYGKAYFFNLYSNTIQ